MSAWLCEHSRELIRGALLGLIAGIVVCVLSWKACPAPASGQTEAQVVERWGAPDEVLQAAPEVTGNGVRPMKKMLYRCGLFGTSLALIYVDPQGRVVDVVHGRP